jgi:hypothetical protein
MCDTPKKNLDINEICVLPGKQYQLRRAAMTTTTQALGRREKRAYAKIKEHFNMDESDRKKIKKTQGRILRDAIKSLDARSRKKLQGKVANLVQRRILDNSRFQVPEDS